MRSCDSVRVTVPVVLGSANARIGLPAAIAALPTEEQSLDQTFVTTSMRLPYPLHQALRAYAEARGTTVTTVLRQWIELHLTADDKPIRLEDAVRVLAALPRAA